MKDILVHISAPQSFTEEFLGNDFDEFQVVSTREVSWEDSPRFGLAEGILIIGVLKSVAELAKIILEIVQILKKPAKSNTEVHIELSNGSAVTITSVSDASEVIQEITKSLSH